MLFHQLAAPAGWTKDVAATLDDSALRVVTSTTWVSAQGGATAFSSIFGSSKTTAAYALLAADVPNHGHADTFSASSAGAHAHDVNMGGGGGSVNGILRSTDLTSNNAFTLTNGAPSAGAHSHPVTGSVTATSGGGGVHSHDLSLDLNYINLILATKD